MGLHNVSTFCLLLLSIQNVFGEVWNFGKPSLGSVKLLHHKGHVGLFTRTKNIKLEIPKCYMVSHVTVDVVNIISTPEVFYNSNTNVVTIHYGTFQNSLSSYDIVAEGLWKMGCTN
ncbi:uncharacterized protein LOC118263699 [Spodoptera frugiperda]|uniref:Uncharacterized protein LOC118263699 n=1 Tax=Spodoptera frugiperda TaxID=7108 RepID=A0A9R0CWM1_SPOFR|nr:uncharacterized protein LOC118263699 [Spodoptera frugiperda]